MITEEAIEAVAEVFRDAWRKPPEDGDDWTSLSRDFAHAALTAAQPLVGVQRTPTREQIIAEIMKLVRPEPKPLERPTIAELEKILNSETTDAVDINPDGSITTRPTVTTVGAVADAILALVAEKQTEKS